MPKYVLAYTGGKTPASEEEGKKSMEAWVAWIGSVGSSMVDIGNPFGSSKTVASDGKLTDGAPANLAGYSIVSADSIDDASKFAESCPQLAAGGAVEIYETLEVM